MVVGGEGLDAFVAEIAGDEEEAGEGLAAARWSCWVNLAPKE